MEQPYDSAWEKETHLRELAARHRVRFEVLPDTEVVGHKLVRVGYFLDLYGLHEHPEGVMPGCPECSKVFAALHEIAEWILPTEHRPSRYEIESFDQQLHMAPDIPERDEVRLQLAISHRRDYFAPIDACEEHCLKEMKEKLGRLGIGEGRHRAGAG